MLKRIINLTERDIPITEALVIKTKDSIDVNYDSLEQSVKSRLGGLERIGMIKVVNVIQEGSKEETTSVIVDPTSAAINYDLEIANMTMESPEVAPIEEVKEEKPVEVKATPVEVKEEAVEEEKPKTTKKTTTKKTTKKTTTKKTTKK